jgi:hypothetical protein
LQGFVPLLLGRQRLLPQFQLVRQVVEFRLVGATVQVERAICLIGVELDQQVLHRQWQAHALGLIDRFTELRHGDRPTGASAEMVVPVTSENEVGLAHLAQL